IVAPLKYPLLTGSRLDDGRVGGHDDELAAFHAPEKARVIVVHGRALAITAEEVERAPAKPISVGCPSLVEKSATIIDELRPSLLADVWRHPSGVQPGQCLGPRSRYAAIVLCDCGALFLRIRPNTFFVLGTSFRCFRWFRCPPGRNPRIWLTLVGV